MKTDGIEVVTLNLKKVSPREWEYSSFGPKRVELAALDWYKSQGWFGYFTEECDLDQAILMMMCWWDWEVFDRYSRPRLPNSITSLDTMFYYASDGIFPQKRCKYKQDHLIQSLDEFDLCKMTDILRIWRSMAAPLDCAPLLSKISITEAEELVRSYYELKGGKYYFRSLIEKLYPNERRTLMTRARRLIDSDKYSIVRNEQNVLLREQLLKAHFYLGVASRLGNIDETVDDWISQIGSLRKLDAEGECLQLAKDIKDAFDGNFGFKTVVPEAVLDLTIWKDDLLCTVEIKSPNDRLRPNQLRQIKLDRATGHLSWVLKIIESSAPEEKSSP